MKPVGYLTLTKGGLTGDPGVIYNYWTAGNGVFIDCSSQLLSATICIAPASIRGLGSMGNCVNLPKGYIPLDLLHLAISTFKFDPARECYHAITWENGQYCLHMPPQHATGDRVRYGVLPNTVVDIHSHAAMPAFFSGAFDDTDEQGFRLSVVVGRLDTDTPEVKARVGVYGYFTAVSLEDIFK